MEKEGEKALGKLQVKESKGKGWGEKGELLLSIEQHYFRG